MAGLFGSPEIQRLAEDDPEEYYKQTPFVRSLWESRLPTWLEQAYKQDVKPAIDAASAPTMEQVLRAPYNLASGAVKGAIDTIDSAQKDPSDPRKMLGLALMTGAGGLLGGAPRGSLGMFAGRRAKTANLEKMKIAQKMLDDGVERTDVWKQTGWMRGPDGKMRFEIDDSGSALNLNYVTDENMGDALIRRYNETDKIQTSEDVLHHNDLYGAYPDLEDIHTAPGAAGRGASYSPNLTLTKGAQGKELIQHGGGDAVSSRSPQLHELQHAVQHQEGFARGGNLGDAVESLLSVRNAELKKISKAMDGRESELGLSGYRPKTDDSVLNTMRQRYDYLQQTNPATDEAAYEWYKRLAGEAEARNVQTRMDYSPEQRLDEPPWTTLDVPEADQIVRGATDGSQMSIPMDEASRMARAETSKRDGILTISKIETPTEYRGQGLADKELRRQLAIADKEGLSVALTPSRAFGAQKGRLVKWYKKYGFVPNKGKNKDFMTRESMIRPAKTPKAKPSPAMLRALLKDPDVL